MRTFSFAPQATSIKKVLEANGIDLNDLIAKTTSAADDLKSAAASIHEDANKQMSEADRVYNEGLALLRKDRDAVALVVTEKRSNVASMQKRANELHSHVRRVKV